MLNTNFINQVAEVLKINDVEFRGFELVVKHELLSMQVQDYDNQIASLNKKIANQPTKQGVYPYTEAEVEGFKAQRDKLQGLRDIDEDLRLNFEPHKKDVISVMVKAGNRENSIINLARIIACTENSKLYKYAIIDTINDKDLFKALENCHDITASVKEGTMSITNIIKASYKQAEDSIARFFRESLSINVENKYTQKVMIRLNTVDLRLLHELYVKGFSNEFAKEKDGAITFTNRKLKTAITKTTKKDGTYTLNFSKFATDIAMIVVAKIAK